jgi:hypothetical protein
MQQEIELLNDGPFESEDARTTRSPGALRTGGRPYGCIPRAVITAAEKVSPSVVYIEVHQPQGEE